MMAQKTYPYQKTNTKLHAGKVTFFIIIPM